MAHNEIRIEARIVQGGVNGCPGIGLRYMCENPFRPAALIEIIMNQSDVAQGDTSWGRACRVVR